MSSIRRIQLEAEEGRRQRETLLASWIPDVLSSRLIIHSDETSYIDKVGVYSSTILRRQFEQSVSEEILKQDYVGLTDEDLKACFKFEVLRSFKLL